MALTGTATSVYIIESGSFIKIGVAADPQDRARSLNTGAPIKATVYRSRLYESRDVAMQVERRLHRYFSQRRANGEWFKVPKAEAWRILCKLETPAPRVGKKSHHVGPDQDQLAIDELREAMNATEAADRQRMQALA